MSNPVFNESRIESMEVTSGATMTVSGTIHKTIFLTALAAGTATAAWPFAGTSAGWIGLVAGLIIALIAVFAASWKPALSPVLAPVYAVSEGAVLGIVSATYNAQSGGIVLQAILITFGILFTMLAIYEFRIIRVTDTFRSLVVSCTIGIALLYLVTFALQFFGVSVPFLHDGGWMGIGISLFIIVIAAMNFLLDFDNIEKGASAGAPKYCEWLAGLGVLVTLVWLYLEVLRLLAKLNRR